MRFIEMQGKTLLRLLSPEDVHPDELRAAGFTDESLVRVNLQGDIEMRREHGWEIIGGLLGEFDERVRAVTGFDWA